MKDGTSARLVATLERIARALEDSNRLAGRMYHPPGSEFNPLIGTVAADCRTCGCTVLRHSAIRPYPCSDCDCAQYISVKQPNDLCSECGHERFYHAAYNCIKYEKFRQCECVAFKGVPLEEI